MTQEALRRGALQDLFCDKESYIFVRASQDETVLVAFNNSGQQRRLIIPVAETPAAPWLSLQPIFGGGSATLLAGKLSLVSPAKSMSLYRAR